MIGVEFHHGEGHEDVSHLSGMAVRYRTLLLDHLATFFAQSGWSVKKLHRLLVLSAAYRQRSDDRGNTGRKGAGLEALARCSHGTMREGPRDRVAEFAIVRPAAF